MLRKEMRRSSVWFLIAALWLIDTLLGIVRGHVHQAWLPAIITLIFIVVGLIHRSREAKAGLR